jgi:hypothetical protein
MRSKQIFRRSGSAASVGRSLARTLDFECIRSASLPHNEVVRNFRKVEKFYLKELRGNPELALETRRRVAEHLLDQAILNGCAQRVCSSRLRTAAELGFTTIEREAHFRLLYARGALARGHVRIARKTAAEMAGKLERSLRRRRSLLAKQYLMQFQELLTHLESQP